MNKITEISDNKFEFDTENNRCWYYVGAEKVEIDPRWKSKGEFNYQVVWQLDENHKDFWINYTLTYSQGKSWINSWYKKKIEASSEAEGYRYLHYKKRQSIDEYSEDKSLVIIEFDYHDEMVKVWDAEKNKHRFVNRLKWDEEQKTKISDII